MAKPNKESVYSADEIASKLAADLPHWVFEDGWIRRKYKTSGWKATLMVVNTVGHLAVDRRQCRRVRTRAAPDRAATRALDRNLCRSSGAVRGVRPERLARTP